VIRSDAGDTHRLSLSARVLSTMVSQVKAKAKAAEALLTSMKTTSEQCIWPLYVASATLRKASFCTRQIHRWHKSADLGFVRQIA
jgi:hypothetical protein